MNATPRAGAALLPRGDTSIREIAVKTPTAIMFAAAVLLAGVSVASAAPQAGAKTAAADHAEMTSPASDALKLTTAQRQKAWNDLYTGALNQQTPAGFKTAIGATVPRNVVTAPVTAKAAGDVPSLKPYKFAMVQKKLVIVNPRDGKIADVISRRGLGLQGG